MNQPLTVKQVARRSELSLDSCGFVLWELEVYCLVQCLNPVAGRSRLYWLTKLGMLSQQELCKKRGLPIPKHDFPNVDWETYGWICFSHRSAVVKALSKPMQPATMKRLARFRDPKLGMSANNVRDIIRLFLEKGIVRRVSEPRKVHPRYELTEIGKRIQSLLFRAESGLHSE